MKFVEVIEYNKCYPEGHFVKIPQDKISKFYKLPDNSVYELRAEESKKEAKKKYKNLIKKKRVEIKWDKEYEWYTVSILLKHKTIIERDKEGLTYYYFSDLSYEEFEEKSEIYQSPILITDTKNRFEILDL